MASIVRKWGNSAAVRIPAATLEAAGLKSGDPVDVREENGRVVIEKVRSEEITLDTLLAGVTPENIHAEFDWGPAVGREIW
jgi:antitoxin MazE